MPNLLPPFKLNYDYLDKLHADKEYKKYLPNKISRRKFEHIEISKDSCVFRLKDKIHLDIVSIVVVEKKKLFGNELLEIKWTKSSMPRQKHLSYLFDLLLIEFEFKILSDKYHTSPGSKEYWLSLGRKKNYDLYIYNPETNYKRKYENVSEEKIWGLKREYLEEINELLIDIPDFNVFNEEYDIDEEYEFEGLDDIDLAVLDANVASKEIYAFVIKYNGKIADKENIRLLAQKTT